MTYIMDHRGTPTTASSRQNDRLGPVLLMVALLCGLVAFFWFQGATDRVTYLGHDNGRAQTIGEVEVKTDPYGLYVLPRNDAYRAMKVGCRYDFTYGRSFGRNRGAAPGLQVKNVHSAKLVDCP